MDNAAEYRRYSFPRIVRVELHSFSLFSLRPDAAIAIRPGVFCLAGANGIGKSTFLNTVNYGLTGSVPHPRRRLLSLQDYVKDATEYSRHYFDGRISEADRDDAAVSISFDLGGHTYEITRGLFDSTDLRRFGNGTGSLDSDVTTPSQRNEKYRSEIERLIGLSSFDQYVFLQHFIFTFDEARHLLFWDDVAIAQSLFLCFGGSPDDAARADHLARESEKAGSRGRNAQFQVNNTRKRITLIEQSISESAGDTGDVEALNAEYQALVASVETAAKNLELAEAKLSESEVKIAQQSAVVAALRANYTDTFNRYIHGDADPQRHPVVEQSLNEQQCAVCQTSGADVVASIRSRLADGKCPLCGSPLADRGSRTAQLVDELADVDAELNKAREALEEATKGQKRSNDGAQAARVQMISAREHLVQFEKKNQDLTDHLKALQATREGPIAQTLDGLRKASSEFSVARDAAYAERDELRDQLKKLQRNLELRYAQAEETFVPRFRQLAELFLGIDLDVSMRLAPPSSISLVLELRGSERHSEDQLSESQRFFVDIALRMALAQQISSQEGAAGLLIDTPEGSLDIAYEDRAGEMFAMFVQSGHDLLMTANINSSKLLTTLASKCGSKFMTLNQMTGWTELSDVQQNATQLFQEAFAQIVSAMQNGPARSPADAQS
ncbi:MAG: AAA family ATPase [Rhizomicrobium sp.]|jgi:DNA repair exonuclease SbcCD ATPase subunit